MGTAEALKICQQGRQASMSHLPALLYAGSDGGKPFGCCPTTSPYGHGWQAPCAVSSQQPAASPAPVAVHPSVQAFALGHASHALHLVCHCPEVLREQTGTAAMHLHCASGPSTCLSAADSSAAGRPDRAGASSTAPNVALLEAAAAAVAAAAAAAADPLQLQPRAMHLQSKNPEVVRLLEQALNAVAAGQSSIGSGGSGGSGAAPAGTPSQLLPTSTVLAARPEEAGDRQQQQQGAQEAAAAIAAALLQGFQEQLMASAEQGQPYPRQGGGQAARTAAAAQLDMRPLLQAVTTLLESSWPGNLTIQQAGPAMAQQEQQHHHHHHHHHPGAQAEHPPAAAEQHAVRPQQSMPSSIPQEACRLNLLEQRVQRQQEAIDSQGAQLARVQQQLQSLFFALLAAGGDVGQGAQSAPQQATATAPPPGHHEQAAAPLAAAAEALPAQGRPARSGGRGKGKQAARKSGSAQPAVAGATPQLAALSVVPETGSAPLHERALHEQSPTTPAGAGTASPCTAACAAALLPSRGSGASANTSVQLASEQGSGAVPGGEATGHDGSIRKRARHGGSPKAHAPEQSGKAVTGH